MLTIYRTSFHVWVEKPTGQVERDFSPHPLQEVLMANIRFTLFSGNEFVGAAVVPLKGSALKAKAWTSVQVTIDGRSGVAARMFTDAQAKFLQRAMEDAMANLPGSDDEEPAPKVHSQLCKGCSDEFEPEGREQYCSPACKRAAAADRHAARKAAAEGKIPGKG